MESRDPDAPYALLALLIRGGAATSPSFRRQYAARATNLLLWASLISVTLLLLRQLLLLVRLWALGAQIPGPWPLAAFRPAGDLTGFLSKLHEEYGAVVRLWLSPTRLLVSVKDAAMIGEVLARAEDKAPSTWWAFARSSFFVSPLDKVKKMRDNLALQMNGRLLERVGTVAFEAVERVMGMVDSDVNNEVVDCRLVSQRLSFYTIGAALFGDAFFSWSDVAVYQEVLMVVAKEACFWDSFNVPPFWRRGYWRYRALCARLRRLTEDIVEQCARGSDLGRNDCNGEFVVQEVMEGSSVSKDEDEHCGNMMDLMLHGYLTTASLLASTLTWLALYPEIQEKIYSEIISEHKPNRKACLLDAQKMPFLLAFVYESVRLLPAGTLLQRYSLKHDLSLQTNITIPAGAIVVVPLQLVHLDNSLWGKDACQFNPHRFLLNSSPGVSASKLNTDSASTTPVTGAAGDCHNFEDYPSLFPELNNYPAFLAFGSGACICLGQKFAILGISKLVLSLLQIYKVRLQPDFEKGMKSKMEDRTVQLLPSPKVIFTKREN